MEQLHRIFKLCGSPSEEYWKKAKLPHATIFKPQQSYKRCLKETFKDFPPSALSLIETLLAIDPSERQTATAALDSEVSFLRSTLQPSFLNKREKSIRIKCVLPALFNVLDISTACLAFSFNTYEAKC